LWLIAGLGNPGLRYSRTRHNIGFLVLDLFASRQKCPWEERKRFATIGSDVLDEPKILLVKPQTYMNRSGEVVGRILDESGVPMESVIVVHDDMDLPFETMKIKKGGGAGGHRGIESILWELGSDRFLRVKMGIGRPEAGEQPEDYVLGAFPDEQVERLPQFLMRGAEALECILEQGIDRAMNLFNTRIRGEGEEAEQGTTVEE
jgi:PTH1 family peptidyl-tRNA hydrolase